MSRRAVELGSATSEELRAAIRSSQWTGPTAGLAEGFAQANVAILPEEYADEFEEFCAANPRACPLLERLPPGDPFPQRAAFGADLRTDVPRYRVFHHGVADAAEPTSISEQWRDDLVGFLLGCSFTFEAALARAGLPVRHVELGRNVSMYRTRIECTAAGRFAGPLVVSMRPYLPEVIPRVCEVTAAYPRMHGAPLHHGDPVELGICDLLRPEFGDSVPLLPGEVPVFWACGVTPQLALATARPPLAITHSPGCMFVTDWPHEAFREPILSRSDP